MDNSDGKWMKWMEGEETNLTEICQNPISCHLFMVGTICPFGNCAQGTFWSFENCAQGTFFKSTMSFLSKSNKKI